MGRSAMAGLVRILGFYVALLGLAAAPALGEERIISFDSNITVAADGMLTVVETIKAKAEGVEIKRGVYRDFPTYNQYPDGSGHQVGFKVVEVRRNGQVIDYFTEPRGMGVRVYMGDKAFFIDPGVYTYALTYKTTRQLRYFAEYDELNWNVTGNDWVFPIDAASVTIVMLPGASVVQQAAYTGPAGAQGQDWTAGKDAEGNPTFRTTRSLAAGEGLTVAVAWPKGLVAQTGGMANFLWWLRGFMGFIVPGIGIGLIWLIYYVKWTRHGRDPKAGTIYPLFTPPDGLAPAAARYVRRMGFDQKAIGAAVVNLAVKGRIEIVDDGENSYELRRLSDSPDPSLSDGERAMETALFAAGNPVRIRRDNRAVLQSAVSELSDSLTKLYKGSHFIRKLGGLGKGILLSFVTLGATGFAMSHYPAPIFGIHIGAFAMPGTVVALVAVNVMFIIVMKAPTAEGRVLLDGIEGFRMYLSVAEQGRLNMLNPPERTPELFEKYLPYAIALDVENEWGEQFNDVLAAASENLNEGGYRPAWYRGDTRGWTTGAA